MENINCYLLDKNTNEKQLYTEATYTKINGMYGYVCVDGLKALFFYEFNGSVCKDELTNVEVTYEIKKN